MYEVKPIIDQKKNIVDLPTTMYKVKSFYENSFVQQPSLGNHIVTNGVISDDRAMEALQKRQIVIIEQLKDLKATLLTMHKQLGSNDANLSNKSTIQSSNNNNKNATIKTDLKPINAKYLQDVVINANPKNIPYSLIALQNIWQNRLNLTINCYTHSTIGSLPEPNQFFANQLKKNSTIASLPTLNISLIWKETKITELICAPTSFVPIAGEVNVIRYLSRVGPKEFGYGDTTILESLEIDSTLDLCHQLFVADNAKERLATLRKLSIKLGNQRYFGGNQFSVSDIAISSAFKQLPVSSKDITPNLNNWIKLATTTFGY